MAQIPDGAAGAAIRRGRELVEHTHELRPANVGNGLHCTSCHLDGGTLANAGPWIGLPAVFPEFRARSGKVDSLSRRVNDCFERSMNGTALDPDSEDMAAILGYMTFISRAAPDGRPPPGRGFPRITPPPAPDRQAGAEKFATRCASCHGADGAGLLADGKYAVPAVWGPRSFNIGAGMARLDTAAAFIRANMPRGAGGTLSAPQRDDGPHAVVRVLWRDAVRGRAHRGHPPRRRARRPGARDVLIPGPGDRSTAPAPAPGQVGSTRVAIRSGPTAPGSRRRGSRARCASRSARRSRRRGHARP